MAIVPENLFSLPLKALQSSIANSDAFKTWVGAADLTAAALRIHYVGVDIASVVRPFALIDFGGRWENDLIGDGGQSLAGGELLMLFEDAVATGNAGNHGDAKLAFTNTVGEIIDQIQNAGGVNSFLSIHKTRLKSGPVRSTKDERDAGTDIYQVTFEVIWGV